MSNETDKKLKANMAMVQANCITKSLQNSKAQSNIGSGEPQPAPRRQVRFLKSSFLHFIEPSFKYLLLSYSDGKILIIKHLSLTMSL